jgi:hypothetical protein
MGFNYATCCQLNIIEWYSGIPSHFWIVDFRQRSVHTDFTHLLPTWSRYIVMHCYTSFVPANEDAYVI